MGTAAYMAPEQANGKRVDKRADSLSTPRNNHSAQVWEIRIDSVLNFDRAAKREIE